MTVYFSMMPNLSTHCWNDVMQFSRRPMRHEQSRQDSLGEKPVQSNCGFGLNTRSQPPRHSRQFVPVRSERLIPNAALSALDKALVQAHADVAARKQSVGHPPSPRTGGD